MSEARFLPQDSDAEESLLGAMLLKPSAVEAVRSELDAGDFYRESHARIFHAVCALHERGEPTEPLFVAAELERRGQLEDIGGRVRLHELARLVPATANAPHYARRIREKARQRTVIRELEPVVSAAWNGGTEAKSALAALDHARAVLLERPGTRPGFEPLDLSTLLAGEPPAIPWLWHGWLAHGDLALIVGDPGVGKSLLGLSLALAVRTGETFLDATCERGRVGIFDLENPLSEAHKRLRAGGLEAEEHEGLLYFHQPSLNLAAPGQVQALAEALEENELDLCIIDSLRRAAPGLEENDSAAVSAVLSPLRALTARTGRTVVLIHHARKRVSDNPTDAGQMVRGSGDMVASLDSMLYLRRKDGGAFTLEHGKSRRGIPHEPVLVRIESEDDRLTLRNEGSVATADDKVEAMLARIVEALRADGGPLGRPVLAMRVGTEPKNGTYSRALKLGWQRSLLAKTAPTSVGEPTLYALADQGNG